MSRWDTCGGKLAIEVFYTGVTVNREMQKSEMKEQVRIVFILTVSVEFCLNLNRIFQIKRFQAKLCGK